MQESAAIKLREIVKTYKELFPDEYRGVAEIVKQKRKGMKDKFASVEGQASNPLKASHVMERALFEISETLNAIIYRQLEPQEYAWFTSKEGGRWFQKTFREFSLAESI